MVRKLTSAAALCAAILASHPASGNEIRVLESSDRSIVVELSTDDYAVDEVVHGGAPFARVSAPGCDWAGDGQGLPRLPVRGALLGVPFGSRVALEVVSVESAPLDARAVEPAPVEEFVRDGDTTVPVQRFEPDEAFYRGGGSYPAEVASLGFDAVLRHQRTVQVLFHPFQWSASGGLVLNRRIVVRLALSPGAAAERMVPASLGEREWDGVYAGTVLNHGEARPWRMRAAPRADRAAARLRPSEAWRFEVERTGIHRLSYADLAAAGFSSTPAVGDVAVYERSFDRLAADPFVETPVPCVVVDADSDGLFDGDDAVLFYGRSFEDRFVSGGWEDHYASRSAYWLAVDPTLAARMTSRPAWHGWTGLTPPTHFPETLRYEQDSYFDASPPSDQVDFYTWTSYYMTSTDDYRLPFSIHDADPAGGVVLRVRFHGNGSGAHSIVLSIVDGANQESLVDTFDFDGVTYSMNQAIFESASLPASYFTDGQNRLHGVGNRTGADLDWLSVSYRRAYAAVNGRLAFASGEATGDSQFEVARFPDSALRAFDVTDPLAPVVMSLGAQNVVQDGGTWRLVLQDEVDHPARYEAVVDGGALAVTGIERRVPADLAFDEADMVVVSHEDFADEVAPLVARREEQGFAVALALVEDVYDEFGGGMASPDAIRAYLRYAFEEWSRPPQFALLVGDASEDTRSITTSSAPNYVPTYIHVAVPNDDLVGSDSWYGCFIASQPYLPSVGVGRLPVGSASEASTVVAKILAYENYAPGDAWRNNVFFLADDLWSYVTLESPYTRKPYESGFTDICMDLADVVAASPAGVDTTVFAMRRYTDPYHGTNTSGDITYLINTQNFVRDTVTTALIDALSEGAVIVNFQGHGNRTLMTHETLLQVRPTDDIARIENDDRPFIFMGYSCQLARFHYWSERTSGDCITERMLNASPNRGAVAVFASSGTEYLSTNEVMNEKVFEAFFEDPTPDGPPEDYVWARWSLGGNIAKAIVKYVTVGRPSSPARTFCFFGDPLMHLEMSPPTVRVTVAGEPKLNGDYLEATGDDPVEFVADIIDEVEIDPATIEVAESDVGVIDPAGYQVRAMMDTTAQQSRWYRVTYTAPIRRAVYDLTISATDANGRTTTFVLHVAEGAEISIRDVANHPNPFTDSTKIIYLLSQSGARVRVSVYTVGGRLIRVFEDAPNSLSYNELEWDGTDAQGDRVANGVYLYVIEAKGDGGDTAVTPVGRMLKAR